MLCLQGMSATLRSMTFSKRVRKPQEDNEESCEQVTQVQNFSAPRKLVIQDFVNTRDQQNDFKNLM